MRAVVVYESMYGNTHQVADAIGAGLRSSFEVSVVPVSEAGPAVLADADLVVVGGPTHVHGMSRAGTRKAAVQAARTIDPSRFDEKELKGASLAHAASLVSAIPQVRAALLSLQRDFGRAGAVLVGDEDEVMLISTGGVAIRTRVKQIREQGRSTQGVRLIDLDEGTKLAGIERVAEKEEDEENGQPNGQPQ